ncbi:hypothetical protein DFH06DRAFT_379552 [Mycena polygramma]|nr:hypothetical protein DFH06DRAFT_379552 [Mycena polygramma]
MTEAELDILTASFSARFLPALVEAYKSVPYLFTSYAGMLRTLLDSGYFAKFMRSSLGRDLYVVHAERVAQLDVIVDMKNVDGMENSVAILVFLMVYSDHYHRNIEPLPQATKFKLIRVLQTVQRAYALELPKGTFKDGVERRRAEGVLRNAGDAERFLVGQLTSDKMLGAVGQMMPWVTCGGYDTGCWAKGKQKGRLGCARCETQTYCSKEHQKADWPVHKHCCFETAY